MTDRLFLIYGTVKVMEELIAIIDKVKVSDEIR